MSFFLFVFDIISQAEQTNKDANCFTALHILLNVASQLNKMA